MRPRIKPPSHNHRKYCPLRHTPSRQCSTEHGGVQLGTDVPS